jgi:hypothetical protein
VPAVATVSVPTVAPIVTVQPAPAPRDAVVVAADPPIPFHRPLHLVHSVFLI